MNPSELSAFFRPRHVAFLAGSERSLFAKTALDNASRVMSADRFSVVHGFKNEFLGHPTVPSCASIEGGIDLAFLMVSRERTIEALEDAAQAGASAAIILSQGWGESGSDGVALQSELLRRADELGILLLGPNSLGVMSAHDAIAAGAFARTSPVPGEIALISQSGALANGVLLYAAEHGVSFSLVAATGNEAAIGIEHLLDYAILDEHTRAIAIFAETIRDPQAFLAAADRAADAGKPIVILKAGSSEIAARSAASHTGAMVGDDRLIDAALRQHGVSRVTSLEDLLTTAHLGAVAGRLHPRGLAVVSISGGACDLFGDRSEVEGAELASLDAETVGRLQTLPEAIPRDNPMDITGAALADTSLWTQAIETLASDPAVGLLLAVARIPSEGEEIPASIRAIGASDVDIPVLVCSQTDETVTHSTASRLAEVDIRVLGGVDRAVTAVSRIQRWSRWLEGRELDSRADAQASGQASEETPTWPDSREHGELAGRRMLERVGVPVVPAILATSPAEAVAAARSYGGSCVLKIASADIAHKSDIGGVRVGVLPEHAGEAYSQIRASASDAAPEATIDGVLVSPMRESGLELVVGLVRHEGWGTALVVGFGGIFVEVLRDTSLRLLPVSDREIHRMLGELKAAPLLDGVRGGQVVDRDELVACIRGIARMAEGAGPQIESFEVNPLRVTSAGPEALDALVEWAD